MSAAEAHFKLFARSAQSRSKSEQCRGHKRSAHGKTKHGEVRPEIERERQWRLWKQREKKPRAPYGQKDGTDRAGEREEKMFGEQLPGNSPATGTESETDHDLLSPGGVACQRRVREMRSRTWLGLGTRQRQAASAEGAVAN